MRSRDEWVEDLATLIGERRHIKDHLALAFAQPTAFQREEREELNERLQNTNNAIELCVKHIRSFH